MFCRQCQYASFSHCAFNIVVFNDDVFLENFYRKQLGCLFMFCQQHLHTYSSCQQIVHCAVCALLTLDLRSSSTIDASGGQCSPGYSVCDELWYVVLHLTSARAISCFTVWIQSIRGRPGFLLQPAGVQLSAVRASASFGILHM